MARREMSEVEKEFTLASCGFMAGKPMSGQEVELRIAQVRTGMAFGGCVLTKEVEQDLRDVHSGECTYEDIKERLREKHSRV